MITLLEEIETLTQIVCNAGRPHTQPPGQIHQHISRNLHRKIRLKY